MMATKYAVPRRAAWRHLLFFDGGVLLCGVGVLLYLYLRARGVPFFCAFSRMAHLYCPGCGATRALEFLWRGDILSSLAANPGVLCGIFSLGYYQVSFLLAVRRGGAPSPRVAIGYAVLLLSFFVVRNLLLVFFGVDPLSDLISYWSTYG